MRLNSSAIFCAAYILSALSEMSFDVHLYALATNVFVIFSINVFNVLRRSGAFINSL